MKIIEAEVVRATRSVPLAQEWEAAWLAPNPAPVSAFNIAFYRLETDEGLVGIGPFTGADPKLALKQDPGMVRAFWEGTMSGRTLQASNKGAAGLEVAMWDLIGKHANQPIHRLLGAVHERLPAYAATTRLLTAEEHVKQAREFREIGFRAMKLRLHRETPDLDLAVVEAVSEAVGSEMTLLVDANQNSASPGYNRWSRRTALWVAERLHELGVAVLEEPLSSSDIDGWCDIARAVPIELAGGETLPTADSHREWLRRGAFEVTQPDVTMGGNIGITGLLKVAQMAEAEGRQIMPHVSGRTTLCLSLAASLQAMATAPNCTMVEYLFDPPVLNNEIHQGLIIQPIEIEADGCLPIPQGPGLGVELNEGWLSRYL